MPLIFALDLALATGFAFGEPGSLPTSGSRLLKAPKQPHEVAFGNLLDFLQRRFEEAKPDLLAIERPLPLQGFANAENAARTVELSYGFWAIARGVAQRYSIRVASVAPATVRKHFIGRANLGDRAETKRAVIERCQLLGYMPRNSNDDNRADALALWDYVGAAYTTERKLLHLFGEKAPREIPFE